MSGKFIIFVSLNHITNIMKISVIRKHRGDGTITVVNEGFGRFIEHIKADTKEGLIHQYREDFLLLGKYIQWDKLDRLARVCPQSTCKKDADMGVSYAKYNGISSVLIENLQNDAEIEAVKRQMALVPQTLCSFKGADGHSVVTWTKATLPDGTLPHSKDKAELFSAQAYAISVMCLSAATDHNITIEEPSLMKTCLLTVDEEPYVNPHPTSLIIEQPTDADVTRLTQGADMQRVLERMVPGPKTCITFNRVYNTCFSRARQSMPQWSSQDDALVMVTRVAQMCAECGLPEEEVAYRLTRHYYNANEDEVRGAVNNVYSEQKQLGTKVGMRKHQIVALKLRDFLERRYEIRQNVVLNRLEYRHRYSLDFLFRELDRRKINAIHHEACIEGIEPTFGEVQDLLNSTYTPLYNPIEDYLQKLPKWDKRDRITELAQMVPNDNPHWAQLFYRWFLSMVAHWMVTDSVHANQTAPILVGAQGYRKSTFCRLLLPPALQEFFADSIDFRSNIEAERCLSRFLLVNIDEFDQLSERQFAFVKHLFQKPATNIRKMRSETIGTQRRYASFIGTSNSHEILRDPTGNRRYVCVDVTAPIRTEQPIQYEQLYAQAKYLIEHGERYWLNDEDEALVRATNQDFEVETPLDGLFLQMFSVPKSEHEEGTWMSPTEILEVLSRHPLFKKERDNNSRALGHVLTKLNVIRKRSGNFALRYVKLSS